MGDRDGSIAGTGLCDGTGQGMDTAHMAARLQVSRATVRTHVQSLLTKLGVHSRLEAASLAVRCGLLEGGGQPPG